MLCLFADGSNTWGTHIEQNDTLASSRSPSERINQLFAVFGTAQGGALKATVRLHHLDRLHMPFVPGVTAETSIARCHGSPRFPLAIQNRHMLGIACGVFCRSVATKPAIAVTSSLVRGNQQSHHHLNVLLVYTGSALYYPSISAHHQDALATLAHNNMIGRERMALTHSSRLTTALLLHLGSACDEH